MNTIFFRMLGENDKAERLRSSIETVQSGLPMTGTHVVDPRSFELVPGAPFSYWVGENIRRLFKDLQPFESNGRMVKVGLQTGDDFRFIRAWWEVPPERTLDSFTGPDWQGDIAAFQDWCRERTFEKKAWVPFAKGGEYSPFYADLHLMVNWQRDGAELKEFSGCFARNPSYYFRPGLTWPSRTTSKISVRSFPAASIFGHKGPAAFCNELWACLALMQSRVFELCVSLQLAAVDAAAKSYEVGVIQRTPIPDLTGYTDELESNVRALVSKMMSWSQGDETSHLAVCPFSSNDPPVSLRSWLRDIPGGDSCLTGSEWATINRIISSLYGVSDASDSGERGESEIINTHAANSGIGDIAEKEDDDEDATENKNSDGGGLCITLNLISYAMGCIYGRWDIRNAKERELASTLPNPFAPLPVCPPAMLIGSDGLPAKTGAIVSEEWLRARPSAITLPPEDSVTGPTIRDDEYPLRITWNGILVDDADAGDTYAHQENIIHRVREVLEFLWDDKAQAIELEACEILGVSSLREYFRKPTGFFEDHLKRYSKSRRKAPIYWPLSTASGSYTLWIYYHRLTDQTLYQCVIDYINPKLESITQDAERLRGQVLQGGTAGQRNELEKLQKLQQELVDFCDELLRVAQLPYRPNLNDGVLITASPLYKLFRLPRWRKDLEECWKKLSAGEYDWAHLAYSIRPEQVREKCKTDKSLAIAHGLEALYEASQTPKKSKRAKK